MPFGLDERYRIDRHDAVTWLIIDRTVPTSDAGRVVARIEESEECGVRVAWMQPVPLGEEYFSPQSVMDDLVRWRRRCRRSSAQRPVHIPHLPPPGSHPMI